MKGPTTLTQPSDLHRLIGERMQTQRAVGAFASQHIAHYLFLDARGVDTLHVSLDNERRLPSLTAHYPLYDWDEREMRQEYGVELDGHPDVRPLYPSGTEIPAAFVAEGEGLTQIVVGPVHAGIIEPGRFTFSSGGETVVHLDAQLGYSRRGVERFLEGRDPLEVAPKVARICGGCSAARSYAYARALEQLVGTVIPVEVELARLVFAELERTYNHLADLAACASGAGWGRGFALGMALKDRAMRLNALASGHRLLFDAIVPFGVRSGVLADRDAVLSVVAQLESEIKRYIAELFANGSVVSRWSEAGIVATPTAGAFAATGPAARASNAGFDVRTYAPYGAYPEMKLKVARASDGDALARCRVKREELFESLRLVRIALSKLGNARLPQPRRLRIEPGFTAAAVEGPRGAEIVALEIDNDLRLARFHAIAASYRNWPIVARAMDGNIVPDFPLVNKSFNLCYACADR